MTAVMQPLAAVADEDAKTAFFADLERRNRAFDAIRMPCPAWCDKTCAEFGEFGDAVLHRHDSAAVVASTADKLHDPDGAIRLSLWFHNSLDEGTESGIEMDVSESRATFDSSANFSAAQARKLAAELQRLADLIEPEQELLAEQVRVGDWFPVGDEWLYVYNTDADAYSGAVQIYVTVDRDEYPEICGNQDEEPHVFDFGDPVRVRRGGAR